MLHRGVCGARLRRRQLLAALLLLILLEEEGDLAVEPPLARRGCLCARELFGEDRGALVRGAPARSLGIERAAQRGRFIGRR